MSEFGPLLLYYRRRADLGQVPLAARATMSKSYLSLIENGLRQPTRQIVDALAKALHLPTREHDTLLIAAGYAPDWLTPCLTDAPLLYRLWAEVQYRERLEQAV